MTPWSKNQWVKNRSAILTSLDIQTITGEHEVAQTITHHSEEVCTVSHDPKNCAINGNWFVLLSHNSFDTGWFLNIWSITHELSR